jgi:TPR repeat protein
MAQFNLGVLYCTGNGVKKDRARMAAWWGKAARQGHAQSQYNLAVCYEVGDGVPMSRAMAVRYFQLAAGQFVYDPRFDLRRVFLDGGDEHTVRMALADAAEDSDGSRPQCVPRKVKFGRVR